MKDYNTFFLKLDEYYYPSTILFRGVELKLLIERFSSVLKFRRTLDLGCGDGIAGSMVFNNMIDYGLDLSRSDLEKARKRKVYKKLLLDDARMIPIKSGRLDLVFSNCVIEHIDNLDEVLSEVCRVLKKNGYFLFTTPSDCFKHYSIFSFLKFSFLSKFYGKTREKRLQHYNCYSLKEWSKILRKNGFNIVDGYYYFGRKDMEFWDFLSVLFYILDKVNKKLCWEVYKRFFRKAIYRRILSAGIGSSNSSAVCVLAKRI